MFILNIFAANLTMSSLNPRMHSRNIYRSRPDFALMAKTYPSFGQYVKTDIKGKVVFDYNDSNALRELTKTLLKKDFGLEVDIPDDRLIPTVPQRLNYVLFVEDLIQKLYKFLGQEVEDVIGVDVGTGCVAIFPLLGCSIDKKWRFVAVDIDHQNVDTAKTNVQRNGLNERIEVVHCVNDNDWSSVVTSKPEVFHFLMTNPPFFSDNFNDSDHQIDVESKELKHEYHRKKSSANTSNAVESVVGGGEVEFVLKIMRKSLELNNKVMIYSSMLGKKQSLTQLKQILKDYSAKQMISSFVTTELCQGHTKRWAIAWTLVPDLNLNEVPVVKPNKPNHSLIYYLPPLMNGVEYNMKSVGDRIQSLLRDDLKLESFEVTETKKKIEFRIRANNNVWSHQRRRRREMKRKTDDCDDTTSGGNGHKMDDSMEEKEITDTQMSDRKRQLSESEPEDNDCGLKKSKTCVVLTENDRFLLDASLVVRRDKQSVLIEMQTKELAKNKESTYQLFQYFKNKLI